MVRPQDPQTTGDPSSRVRDGRFVFVAVRADEGDALVAFASVEELDGRSLLVPLADAERAGLAHGAALAWVECPRRLAGQAARPAGVLGAALARAGIGCEVVAGARAEHLLVAEEDVARVIEVLDQLATAGPGRDATRIVAIRDGTIRLGQFLKLAGLVGSGSDVKPLLDFDLVEVNGEAEHRRGRQLQRGDIVSLDGVNIAVG